MTSHRSPARLPYGQMAQMAALLFLLVSCSSSNPGPQRHAASPARMEERPEAVSASLRTAVETVRVGKEGKEQARAEAVARDFYRRHGYEPVWSDEHGPLPRAEELVAAIDQLPAEGLDPAPFDREGLSRLLRQVDSPRRRAELDLALTRAFLRLAEQTAVGRLEPGAITTDWYAKPKEVDLGAVLTRALGPEGVRATLAAAEPPSPAFARLRQAYARYGEIAARGGWPEIPAGPKLSRGATGERVRLLATRLAAEGDFSPTPPGTPSASSAPGAPVESRFDDRLAAAISAFQRRNGIEPSGAVDAATLAALKVPAAVRQRQIALNLERWRWLPADFGNRYILVNVPGYELTVVEEGRPAMTMKVVVGKSKTRTPIFSDRMTRIELNPVWNLPDSIVRNEIAPAATRDPGYLARKNLEVYPGWGAGAEPVAAADIDWERMGRGGYRLRQPAGPDNPLGRIKFFLTNKFDVYLHDTPSSRAFGAAQRNLSHGCVRLEHPLDLASYLLRDDPRWSPEDLQDAIDSGESLSIPLPQPIPVHIQYWTAWVDEDGTVQFRKDIYGHDAELDQALPGRPSPSSSAYWAALPTPAAGFSTRSAPGTTAVERASQASALRNTASAPGVGAAIATAH